MVLIVIHNRATSRALYRPCSKQPGAKILFRNSNLTPWIGGGWASPKSRCTLCLFSRFSGDPRYLSRGIATGGLRWPSPEIGSSCSYVVSSCPPVRAYTRNCIQVLLSTMGVILAVVTYFAGYFAILFEAISIGESCPRDSWV
jgi:hypothetical protein